VVALVDVAPGGVVGADIVVVANVVELDGVVTIGVELPILFETGNWSRFFGM
jgi:hypothetical protein